MSFQTSITLQAFINWGSFFPQTIKDLQKRPLRYSQYFFCVAKFTLPVTGLGERLSFLAIHQWSPVNYSDSDRGKLVYCMY